MSGDPREWKAAHVVNLLKVEQGDPAWSFECCHAPMADEWQTKTDEDGAAVEPNGECWLMTWWDGLGSELFDLDADGLGRGLSFPIPVKPSDDWNFDGGSIVVDAAALRLLFDPPQISADLRAELEGEVADWYNEGDLESADRADELDRLLAALPEAES